MLLSRMDTLLGRFCQIVVVSPFWKGVYSEMKEYVPKQILLE